MYFFPNRLYMLYLLLQGCQVQPPQLQRDNITQENDESQFEITGIFEVGYELIFTPIGYITEDHEYKRITWDYGDDLIEQINITKPIHSLYDTTHIYSKSGNYNVSLTIEFTNGDITTWTKLISIGECSDKTVKLVRLNDNIITVDKRGLWNQIEWIFVDGSVKYEPYITLKEGEKLKRVNAKQTDTGIFGFLEFN